MKHLKKGILLLALAFLGALSFTSCRSTRSSISQENVQQARIPAGETLQKIVKQGTLLVGTTGDYRPLSFREPDGTYWGFGIEVAQEIARRLGVRVAFVPTSWPTLSADVQKEPQTFHLALGGITITEARQETMLMSEGYLRNGKTIL